MPARRRQRGSRAGEAKRIAKRVLIAAGGIVAIVFAVQGGEFGTTDLLRMRSRREVTLKAIDSLEHIVDSLRRYNKQLATDPALQERIAREEFGMIRGDKEILYRFADPPDAPVKR